MSRVDAGNPRLYKPTTLLERKNVKVLIMIAEKYGLKSLTHRTKYELIRLIRGRMEEEKEEKEQKYSRYFKYYNAR